ncbi:MAG: CPBP family intramembrane metalloprotease [Erysipelotrichaceae bacterium]|nr:CPBP family intramembrane metalloprotease [Erysipelotrichaceae bacterium]
MDKKARKVSKKYAKRWFSTIGLFLIMYALFVLVLPFVFHVYMVETRSSILNDHILYYGIYFLIIMFGTLIPFFLMRKYFRIKLKSITRKINATFKDLFVQAIVVFTICIASIYASNILFSYLGMESKLLSSIGLSYDDANLSNALYVFMLLFATPLIEEYAFRGVLLSSLSKYGKGFAMYMSALFYSLAHLNFVEFIPAFAMAFLLGKISLRYKSIAPTIIIHIMFNSFVYGLCVVPSGITQYMAYGLVAIVGVAVYLILSGRYEFIKIQKARNARTAYMLFLTRPSVIIAMALMILDTILYMYAQ